MKKAIVVQQGSKVIGVYTNLKKFWEQIENQETKSHYSTVSDYLRYCKPYDLGTCIIAGERIENVTVRRFDTNKIKTFTR